MTQVHLKRAELPFLDSFHFSDFAQTARGSAAPASPSFFFVYDFARRSAEGCGRLRGLPLDGLSFATNLSTPSRGRPLSAAAYPKQFQLHFYASSERAQAWLRRLQSLFRLRADALRLNLSSFFFSATSSGDALRLGCGNFCFISTTPCGRAADRKYWLLFIFYDSERSLRSFGFTLPLG